MLFDARMYTMSFQRLSEYQARRVNFQETDTVDTVKSAIASVLGEDRNSIDIVSINKIIEDSRPVQDLSRPLQVVVHNANRMPPQWLQTDKQDMVNDWEEEPRCLMSCSHAITPDNLYNYCWTKLIENVTSFRCCAVMSERQTGSCNGDWTFQEVVDSACLSADEQILFESRINQNYINQSPDIRECPNCRVTCTRQNTAKLHVRCVVCKKAGTKKNKFCWNCLQPWKKHHRCIDENSVKLLKTCAKKVIDGVPGCPSYRACPRCSLIIEHENKCRNMYCLGCKSSFCFICLRKNICRYGRCRLLPGSCLVAPIQNHGVTRKGSKAES